MHSRIFVLREVIDGEDLPSINDLSCVTEEELFEALHPHIVDYVDRIDDQKEFNEDIKWLMEAEPCFEAYRENNQSFITLDVSKGLELVKSKLEKFLEYVKKISFEEWCSKYSLFLYEMEVYIDEKHGFYVVTVSEDSGWYYETFDEWLYYHCGKHNDNVKFRVEDIFDYHF